MKTLNQIIKSKNDKLAYKAIQLENQLKCVLISDPLTEKCAAVMNVASGSFEDPREFQGLAHFLEHMLFLGSGKYPRPDQYREFVVNNGGSCNAYTDMANTVYYYTVKNGFFVDPLLTPDYVDKEVNAVNSEHEKNINNDAWREFQLMKHLSNPESPFHCFSTGNLSTLKRDGLYDALRTHYQTKYSANVMNLVVYGNEELEALEGAVNSVFADVKDRSLSGFSYTNRPVAFPAENTGRLVRIRTIKSERRLKLVWSFETMLPRFKANPFDVLSHLIGHESNGSLLSFLKSQQLAHELYSSHNNYSDHFTKFEISISLTQKGLAEWEKVLDAVGAYLGMLRAEGVPAWVFDECRLMKRIKFDFQEKSDVLSKSLHVAQTISDFPVEYANILNYLLEEYTPDQYADILGRLRAESAIVLLLNNEFADLPQREPIYGTEFAAEPLPKPLVERFYASQFSKDELKGIHFPPRNTFIPTAFELKPLEPESAQFPANLLEPGSPEGELFFKQDDSFFVPKLILNFMFYFTERNQESDVAVQLAFHLWTDLLKDYLREYLYLAEMANIKLSLNPTSKGLHVRISGFDDSMRSFVPELAAKINEFRRLGRSPAGVEYLRGEFLLKKQKLKQSLEKEMKGEPFRMIIKALNYIMVEGFFSEVEQATTLEGLEFEEYLRHQESVLGEVYFEGLAMGNLRAEEARGLLSDFKQGLAKDIGIRVLPKEGIVDHKVACLPPGKTLILSKDIKTLAEKNNCVLVSFQFDQSYDHVYLFQFLSKYLETPFFEDLRTQQQLGYVVFSMSDCKRGVWAFNFLIQSDVRTSAECAERIYDFLNRHRELVKEVSDQKFEDFRQAILTNYRQKYFNLAQENDAYFETIQRHTYKFNSKELGIQRISTIGKEQFLEMFEKVFFGLRKVLEVHLVAGASKERNAEMIAERARNESHVVVVANEQHLKKLLPAYPDLTMKF